MAAFFLTHLRLTVVVILVFALGVGLGAWAVRALDDAQRAELTGYLDGLLEAARGGPSPLPGPEVLRVSLSRNLRTLAAMWIGGAVVIGVPLVILLLFARGFALGFTVGFLAAQAGWRGIVFSLGAVLPHNLLAVPALWIVGIAGLSFAGKAWLARRRRWQGSLAGDLAGYLLVGLALASLLGLACTVEAYLTPVFVRALGPLLPQF